MIYFFRKEMRKWRPILWVVFGSIALGGLSSLILFRYHPTHELPIATVDGTPIPAKKFRVEFAKVKSYLDEVDRYARASNTSREVLLELTGFGNPVERALDSCIRQALLERIADNVGIILDDETFKDELAETLPAHVFNPDGSLNALTYHRYVTSRQQTIPEFEEEKERDVHQLLVTKLLQAADYVPNHSVHTQLAADHAEKKFTVATAQRASFRAPFEKEGVSAEDLKKYYQRP